MAGGWRRFQSLATVGGLDVVGQYHVGSLLGGGLAVYLLHAADGRRLTDERPLAAALRRDSERGPLPDVAVEDVCLRDPSGRRRQAFVAVLDEERGQVLDAWRYGLRGRQRPPSVECVPVGGFDLGPAESLPPRIRRGTVIEACERRLARRLRRWAAER